MQGKIKPVPKITYLKVMHHHQLRAPRSVSCLCRESALERPEMAKIGAVRETWIPDRCSFVLVQGNVESRLKIFQSRAIYPKTCRKHDIYQESESHSALENIDSFHSRVQWRGKAQGGEN
jgi:hypothetical protein